MCVWLRTTYANLCVTVRTPRADGGSWLSVCLTHERLLTGTGENLFKSSWVAHTHTYIQNFDTGRITNFLKNFLRELQFASIKNIVNKREKAYFCPVFIAFCLTKVRCSSRSQKRSSLNRTLTNTKRGQFFSLSMLNLSFIPLPDIMLPSHYVNCQYDRIIMVRKFTLVICLHIPCIPGNTLPDRNVHNLKVLNGW